MNRKYKIEMPAGLEGCVWFSDPRVCLPSSHKHKELELNLLLEGSVSYFVKGRRYEIRANHLIWLFPNQDHLIIYKSPDLRMWALIFSTRLLKRMCKSPALAVLLQKNPPDHFYKRIALSDSARLENLIQELDLAQDNPPLFNAGLGYLLLSAWAMDQNAEKQIMSHEVHPAVEKAARYLMHLENHDSSLDQLAKQVGLSPSRLSRLFKTQMGVSLVDFKNRLRIESFKQIYQQGQRLNMLEAALGAGFQSYSQFYRVFKKTTTISPHAYRASLGQTN